MWKAGLIVAVVMAITGSVALAEGAVAAPAKEEPKAAAPAPAKPAAPAPTPHEELFWPDMWQTFHNPTSYLSMGLDFRFRIEAGENWMTLNDDVPTDHRWMYERYRTRWWTKWILDEGITFNTRLAWEFRTWQDPEDRLTYVNPPGSDNPRVTHFNPDEALFDWFNINWRNVGDMPLTATIGRQDMIFGVGWLVLDGTPLDGSRTIYFDAARFTYDWADKNTKVDLAYVDMTAESDRWLEPICDKDRGVTEQDEHGAILYLTNTSWKPVQLEGFFIYRNDNPVDELLTNFPYAWSRKAEIYTLGAAVAGTQGDHWKYRVEGAIQRGEKNDASATLGEVGPDRDLESYGTLNTLEYQFKDAHDNATHITYEYASGDDPDTDENEQFDLLWGEWPRWSELLIYTASLETQPASLTNLHRINIGHRLNLNKQWSLTADYHILWADQSTGLTGALDTSDTDRFRGHLFTSWLKYKFSDQLYGHFLAEYFVNAGDYFVSPSNDDAYFLRFNVEYIF
jgi:hypothetical protein